MTKHEVNAGAVSVCIIGLLMAGIALAIDQMGDLALVAALVVAVPNAIGLACIVVRDIGRVRRVRRENQKRPPIGPTAGEVAKREHVRRLHEANVRAFNVGVNAMERDLGRRLARDHKQRAK